MSAAATITWTEITLERGWGSKLNDIPLDMVVPEPWAEIVRALAPKVRYGEDYSRGVAEALADVARTLAYAKRANYDGSIESAAYWLAAAEGYYVCDREQRVSELLAMVGVGQ